MVRAMSTDAHPRPEPVSPPPDPFAVLIRARRKGRQLSLQALGRLVAASAPHLYNIETGRRLPSEALAARIARALGENPEVFRAWIRAAARSDWRTTREATLFVDAFIRGGGAGRGPSVRLRRFEPTDRGERVPSVALRAVEPIRSGPTRILVPILEPGLEPGSPSRVTLRLDPTEFDGIGALERPFGYPLGPGLHPRATSLPGTGHAILSLDPGWPPDRNAIYAARTGEGVTLSPVLWNGSELLIAPRAGESDFVLEPCEDERAGRGLLRGRVILIAS